MKPASLRLARTRLAPQRVQLHTLEIIQSTSTHEHPIALAALSAASVFCLDPTFRMPCYLKDMYNARQSFAEHLIATKALRCTATAWMLTVAESFAKF